MTLLVGLVLAAALALAGATVPVPYVAEGPGPTFNTLGQVDGRTVVDVAGRQTFPTSGHLNMTTVSIADRLTMFAALAAWFSGNDGIVPREEIFLPGLSEQQVEQENTEQFRQSEADAEVAALSYLHLPTKVVVEAVVPGSPAVGLLAAGDRLLVVNGVPVSTPAQVSDALRDTRPGSRVVIRYQRGGVVQDVSVGLGTRPDPVPQGFLGVTPEGLPDVPFSITISLGDIGGPSAGLMFALALVDKLTPGDLAGHRFVAGTGTINDAGVVGEIGGIAFKMAAARSAGATVFLVPTGNCPEAVSRAPAGLRLVRVSSLSDAVAALRALHAGAATPHC